MDTKGFLKAMRAAAKAVEAGENDLDFNPDKIICHPTKGTVSFRHGFYYRHGFTSKKWMAQVIAGLAKAGYVVAAVEDIDHQSLTDWMDSYMEATVKLSEEAK